MTFTTRFNLVLVWSNMVKILTKKSSKWVRPNQVSWSTFLYAVLKCLDVYCDNHMLTSYILLSAEKYEYKKSTCPNFNLFRPIWTYLNQSRPIFTIWTYMYTLGGTNSNISRQILLIRTHLSNQDKLRPNGTYLNHFGQLNHMEYI